MFPVALTGLLSELSYTITQFSWLNWLGRLPPLVHRRTAGCHATVSLIACDDHGALRSLVSCGKSRGSHSHHCRTRGPTIIFWLSVRSGISRDPGIIKRRGCPEQPALPKLSHLQVCWLKIYLKLETISPRTYYFKSSRSGQEFFFKSVIFYHGFWVISSIGRLDTNGKDSKSLESDGEHSFRCIPIWRLLE